MSSESNASPEVVASSQTSPVIGCSDCRTAIRTHYYALDDRPLCPRCKPRYSAKLARGTGLKAFGRAALYGSSAALGGAILLSSLAIVFPLSRVPGVVALGWMVGAAVRAGVGEFGRRRNQVLSGVLVYLAIALACGLSVLSRAQSVLEARKLTAVETPAADSAPASPDTLLADSAAAPSAQAAEGSDTVAATESTEATVMPTAPAAPAAPVAPAVVPRTPSLDDLTEAGQAERLASAGLTERIVVALVLVLTLPLIWPYSYGIVWVPIGLLALGYGLRRAWRITGEGETFSLTGPHRVGTGPIPSWNR